MFKKGDLFFFNNEGKMLFQYVGGENGLIMSERYLLHEKDYESETPVLQYYGYDVLIKGRLFIEIPEKFLLRIIKDEKNTE